MLFLGWVKNKLLTIKFVNFVISIYLLKLTDVFIFLSLLFIFVCFKLISYIGLFFFKVLNKIKEKYQPQLTR